MGLMIPDPAAKAGVEGLTRQLAYDWGRAGIRVNAIAPTVTLTGDRIQGLWEAKSEESVVGDVASHDYLLPSPLATNGCTARLVEGLKVS